MAFKAKFLFINEKLLPKNIFKEIKKICHPAIKRTSGFLLSGKSPPVSKISISSLFKRIGSKSS